MVVVVVRTECSTRGSSHARTRNASNCPGGPQIVFELSFLPAGIIITIAAKR